MVELLFCRAKIWVGSEKAGVTVEETTNKTGAKSFMNMIIVMGGE
jgi:hypothetical protein